MRNNEKDVKRLSVKRKARKPAGSGYQKTGRKRVI